MLRWGIGGYEVRWAAAVRSWGWGCRGGGEGEGLLCKGDGIDIARDCCLLLLSIYRSCTSKIPAIRTSAENLRSASLRPLRTTKRLGK